MSLACKVWFFLFPALWLTSYPLSWDSAQCLPFSIINMCFSAISLRSGCVRTWDPWVLFQFALSRPSVFAYIYKQATLKNKSLARHTACVTNQIRKGGGFFFFFNLWIEGTMRPAKRLLIKLLMLPLRWVFGSKPIFVTQAKLMYVLRLWMFFALWSLGWGKKKTEKKEKRYISWNWAPTTSFWERKSL